MYKIFTILAFVSSLWAYQSGDTVAPEVGKKLGLQSNKTYVIDFFASWCISCKHELPLIEKLSRTLRTKNIEVIGVDVDENLQQAKAFQQELGLTFPVVNDPKGEVIKRFDPVGMPAVYIVKNAKVTHMILGAKDHIDQLILAALKEEK